MRKPARVLLAGLILCAAQSASALAACVPDDGLKMAGPPEAPLELAIELKPGTIPVSSPFQADLVICPGHAGLPDNVTLDATMPAHKHGMNYEPAIRKITGDRYEVSGLLFHMPGLWRFEVTAYVNGKPHRFTRDVNVE
ncbi:MAG: hypothetical protein AAF441_22445 [Pseudomonadota bacterium]